MSAVELVTSSREVARPLSVLAPLIEQDFNSAEEAGMSFYTKAGEKLVEAKQGHFRGKTAGFYKWAYEKFGKKQNQIRTYMALVSVRSDKSFKNLDDFRREGLGRTVL